MKVEEKQQQDVSVQEKQPEEKVVAEDIKVEEKQQSVIPAQEKQVKEVQEQKPKKEKPIYFRLGLTADSHKYLSLMAEQNPKHDSMTKYINMLIEKDKKKNKELYEKLVEIENIKVEALKNIQ